MHAYIDSDPKSQRQISAAYCSLYCASSYGRLKWAFWLSGRPPVLSRPLPLAYRTLSSPERMDAEGSDEAAVRQRLPSGFCESMASIRKRGSSARNTTENIREQIGSEQVTLCDYGY